jgi:hypothetical protein
MHRQGIPSSRNVCTVQKGQRAPQSAPPIAVQELIDYKYPPHYAGAPTTTTGIPPDVRAGKRGQSALGSLIPPFRVPCIQVDCHRSTIEMDHFLFRFDDNSGIHAIRET